MSSKASSGEGLVGRQAHYRWQPGKGAEVLEQAKKEIIPVLEAQAGFKQYTIIEAGPDEYFTFALWTDQQASENAGAVTQWVRDKLTPYRSGSPQTSPVLGQVVVHETTGDGSGPMVGRVAHYRWKDGCGEKALNLAREEIIPVLKQQAGFRQYTIVQAGPDEYVTFAVWTSETASKNAGAVTQFVRDKLTPWRSEYNQVNPVLGPVVVHRLVENGLNLVGRVAHYRWQKGQGPTVLAKAQEEIIPVLRQQEGFHHYTIIQGAPDEYFTFALWTDQKASENAGAVTKYVRDQLMSARSSAPQMNPVLGQVVVHETGPSGGGKLVGRVAHYRWQSGKGKEALDHALREIIPVLKRQEGFHQYTIVQAGPDEYLTFALWSSQTASENAGAITKYVRDQLTPLRSQLPQLNPILGEVVVHEVG